MSRLAARAHVLNQFKKNIPIKCRAKHVWTRGNVVVSPYGDVKIPDLNVVDYTWTGLDRWPTKAAVVCGVTDRSYTYEQLYKLSRNFAANLRKKFKIDNGDVVAIMSPNVPEFPVATYGALTAGAVVTTINPIYTAYEVQRQLELSRAKLVIAHTDIVPVIKEALRLSKKNLPIIAININQDLPEGTICFKELSEDKYADLRVLKDVNRKSSDVVFMPYSSGTTGLPKGAELTNRNLVANCEQQNTELIQYNLTTETNQDTVLGVLPMFHIYGLSIIMLHKLSAGLKMVTLPKFQPDTFLNAMLKHRLTMMYLAPPIVLFLGSHPLSTPKHFEGVDVITSGAAPLPLADVEKLMAKAQREINFCQGYGLTETSPLVTLHSKGSKDYASVGPAIPNVQLRIVDEKMNNLGPGEVGELVIKGPNVMKGYMNNPEANKEVFLDDGWFRSGDIANIDEKGMVYITDRLKELIKVKGFQVPPAELESALKEHPGIHDAAVVGTPDPVTGERPIAFIVLNENSNAKTEDILNFVNERVAPYKRIKEVRTLDSIPKNAAGKILRRELKEKYL